MERARERGFARSIGVSNFSLAELDQLLSDVTTPPVINQVQFSPFEFRRRLLQGCEERGVALEAYSPLGTGRHLRDRRVRQVAERVGRTPAQVLLRWCLQRNLVVLPKSTHRERIVDNAASSTSRCPPRTWPCSTPSTRPGGTDRALGQLVVTAQATPGIPVPPLTHRRDARASMAEEFEDGPGDEIASWAVGACHYKA